MSFGQALEHIKQGGLIVRRGWNGNGMFVYYVPAAKYPQPQRATNDAGLRRR